MRKSKKRSSDVALTASRPLTGAGAFSPLTGESALFASQNRLFGQLRENVPIIDGAIEKTVRLVGGFSVKCRDSAAQNAMDEFLETVNVSGNLRSLQAFVDVYLSQLLTYGTAVGEMLLDKDGSLALYNARLEDISLRRGENSALSIEIIAPSGKKIPINERILFSVLSPEPGRIEGVSLLRSLPFTASILMQIFEATRSNWERVGNLRYAVTYKPQNDPGEKAFASERAQQIAKGWSEAMKSGSQIKDFIAVGDVEIKVIGADSQILDSEIPVRQLTEQIIAKLGIPPFLLGLNWSTTERMAQQQTDIFISELCRYRRILTPVIKQTAQMFLRMNAYSPDCSVEWSDISLLDMTEQAKTQYYLAQAQKLSAQAAAIRRKS